MVAARSQWPSFTARVLCGCFKSQQLLEAHPTGAHQLNLCAARLEKCQFLYILVPLALWFAPLQLEPITKHGFAIVGFMVAAWITRAMGYETAGAMPDNKRMRGVLNRARVATNEPTKSPTSSASTSLPGGRAACAHHSSPD